MTLKAYRKVNCCLIKVRQVEEYSSCRSVHRPVTDCYGIPALSTQPQRPARGMGVRTIFMAFYAVWRSCLPEGCNSARLNEEWRNVQTYIRARYDRARENQAMAQFLDLEKRKNVPIGKALQGSTLCCDSRPIGHVNQPPGHPRMLLWLWPTLGLWLVTPRGLFIAAWHLSDTRRFRFASTWGCCPSSVVPL